MKIVFIGLNSHYTYGLNYHDNSFNRILLKKGHTVTYISDTQYFCDGELHNTTPCDYVDDDGVRLIRVPYLFPSFISKKLKLYSNIYYYLSELQPDIIYCHSPQYFSVFDVIRYKKNHPEVFVYADTHAGYYNVDTNKWYFTVLYKFYYKFLFKSIEPYLTKYFYIGSFDKEFSINVYNSDSTKMYYLPLGGESISTTDYAYFRKNKRKELFVNDDDILILHSGKLDKNKNTKWIIDAVNRVNSKKIKLIIIGNIIENNKELLNLINNNSNNNIKYLGWKSASELLEYICACDIYAQPGSASVTLNNAICYQTPIIAYKHDLYVDFYGISSICWIKSVDDIVNKLYEILSDRECLSALKENAINNKYLLDYNNNLTKALNL